MAQVDSVVRRPSSAAGSGKFGELLVKTGKINQAQLQEALALQKDQGGRLGSNLVKLGFLTDRQLVESLSQHFRVSSVDLQGMDVDEAVIKIIPADIARKYTILPINK